MNASAGRTGAVRRRRRREWEPERPAVGRRPAAPTPGLLLDPRAARHHLGPAQLTALQRSAGNRAVSQLVVQRYEQIDHTRYTMGANARFVSTELARARGAPAYTRTTTEMTQAGQLLQHKERAVSGWGPAVPAAQPTKPTLNYSTDGADKAMALELTSGEPKVLYATDAVKNESNTKLEQVGAAARLEAAGGSLSAPKDLAHPGARHSLKMLRPATAKKTASGAFTVQDRFGELADCNTFIKNVIGEVGARVAVFGGGAGHEAVVDEEHEPTHEIATFANTQPGQAGALTAHLRRSPRGEHDQPTPAVAGHRARQLGINEHARADVGEGYVISGSGPLPGAVSFDQYLAALDKKTQGLALSNDEARLFRKAWGYHYAGVVARVGDDTVTMENYNRGTTAGWELDQLYEDALAQVQAFRAYVQANLAPDPMKDEPNTSFGNLKQRRIFLKNRADKWRTEAAAAKAQGQAVDQAVEQAVDRAHEAQTKGLAVLDATLYFFKMYGAKPGQSFHEQWQGVVDNPMTLRLRQSLPAMVTKASEAVAASAARLDAVGLPPALDGDTDRIVANADASMARAADKAEVTAASDAAMLGLRRVAAEAVVLWGREAAAEMGKPKTAIADPADPATVIALLEKWIASGRALRSGAKRRLADRRQRLGQLRDKIDAVRRLNL